MRLPAPLRGLLLAVLLAVAGAAAPAPALADSPRAAQHDGYGRMVFDWSQPTRLEAARVEGERLLLRFSRPVEGDPRSLVKPLSRYLRKVDVSDGGRRLIFSLARPVALRHFGVGASTVVDLMEQGAAAQEDGAPDIPTVPVRTGEHDTFFRLVFDWPGTVEYAATAKNDEARVVFQRPARVDAAALERGLPRDIGLLSAEGDGSGLAVALALPDGARLRHFRTGSRIVVDIVRAAEPAEGKPAPAPKPTAEATPAAPAEAPPPKPKPQTVAAERSQPEKAAPAPEASKPAATARTEPPPPPPVDSLPPAARSPLAPPDPLTKARLRPPPPAELEPIPDPVLVTNGAGASAGTGGAAGQGSAVGALATVSPPPPPGRLATISFSWQSPVAAAIFRRAGWLWIVFDGKQKVDLAALEKAGDGEVIRFAEQLPHETATVLRLIVEPGVNPTVRRDGLLWMIDLAVQPHRPATPIQMSPRVDGPSPPHLFLEIPEGGPRLPILDPEVGDEMIVVPVVPVSYGVFPARHFPEFSLPATAQGAVLLPRAEGLAVTPSREGIDISRSEGLAISTDAIVAPSAEAEDEEDKGPPVSQILDLRAWAGDGLRSFDRKRREMQLAVVEAPPGRRNAARLDFARFLVANGFGADALGVLDRLAAFVPSDAQTPEFHAVRGIAEYLVHRYDDALRDLESTQPYRGGELALWKAAARARTGDPQRELPHLVQGTKYLADYQRPVKLALAWLTAEAAVKAGDVTAARSLLDLIGEETLSADQKLWLKYLEGAYARIAGEHEEAKTIWTAVRQGDNRKARAHAAFDLIELKLSLGELTPAQAIAELDSLRFAWRDEEFEYALLERLADLQIAQGNYSDGLRTLKSIVSNYPDNPRNDGIAERLRDTFVSLFLGERGNDLAPVTAIALFNEFRELTPPGVKGDRIIRRLADRLVSVDLLEPAAELLRHQVEYRLLGVEKARVAAQLALVELLDHRPQRALQALDMSEGIDTPPELAAQRRHLRARALFDLGRPNQALSLLDGDDSFDASVLRAEFLWRDQKWKAAAEEFSRLVSPPRKGEPVNDTEARFVLHWATALTLAGDDRGIQRLKKTYLQPMQDTAYGDVFALITSDDGGLDLASVDYKIKLADSFQTFMASYRERLEAEGLSAMN